MMTARAPEKPKPNGKSRPRPHAADEALKLYPKLEELPADLPKNGITAVVHRPLLKPDARNPRSIDHYAAQGLKDSIKRTGGLIEDPVWNRRTGLLVGGHQRLTQEDKRRGTQDYYVAVKVVDWEDTFAVEVNVALNNPNLQGQYDIALLDELIRTPEFDFRNAGFDAVNLEDLYLQNGLTFDLPGLTTAEEPQDPRQTADPGRQEAEDAADDIAEQLDEADAAKAAQRDRGEPRSAASRNSVEAIRQRREEYQQQSAYRGQEDVKVELVFPTEELKQAFMKFIQKPLGAERVDGVSVVRFLALDIPEFAEPATTSSRFDDL